MIEKRSRSEPEPDQKRLDRGSKKANRILSFSFHTIFIATKLEPPPKRKAQDKTQRRERQKIEERKREKERNETKEKKPMNVND